MPIMVNLTCENNMLTDIFTYNSVLLYAQIGRVLNWHYYMLMPWRPKENISGS